MEGIPEKCPTCSTVIPEGAVRCPGCGRVFGEDNRCPHCNAIAAVRPIPGGYACLACGKPRDRLPQTTVLGEPDARMSLAPSPPQSAARAGALSSLGVATIGTSAVFASLALALLGFSSFGVLLAVAAAIAGVGGGAAMIGADRRRARDAERGAQRALEQRILVLAGKRKGNLTASEVAKAFRIAESAAEAALMRMSDGSTITAEVDETVGALHFVFHDLVAAPPKTRVEVEGEGEGEGEVEGEREREKKKLSL